MSKLHNCDPAISGGTKLLAEADYTDFAPATINFLSFLNSPYEQARTYFRVWDNRIEMNTPIAPFCCLTATSNCVTDSVTTYYYDGFPFRSSMACYCIPLTCLGPPVVYVQKPSLLCGLIDLTPCCGESLKAAPHNCLGLKTYICCGGPCYEQYGLPITSGLKDGKKLMLDFKKAVNRYVKKHNLDPAEMAIFEVVGERGGASNMELKNATDDGNDDDFEPVDVEEEEESEIDESAPTHPSEIEMAAIKHNSPKKTSPKKAITPKAAAASPKKTRAASSVAASIKVPSNLYSLDFEVMFSFFKNSCGLGHVTSQAAATACIELEINTTKKLAKIWGREALALADLQLDQDDAGDVEEALAKLQVKVDHWVTHDGDTPTKV